MLSSGLQAGLAMKQSELTRWIDLVSFIVFVAMVSTGLVMEYSLPSRSHGSTLLSLTRHQWGDLHYFISLCFVFLMSSHLFLHGKYISRAIAGRASREHRYRLAIGLVCFIALILMAMIPLLAPVQAR
ncbi:MAG: hypothetical protein CMK89_18900 [Pseudomonadales bacterium]|nr:hypothetical protein [Pseudomonadales bacterium]